jgi:alanyl-tRNA synthetase
MTTATTFPAARQPPVNGDHFIEIWNKAMFSHQHGRRRLGNAAHALTPVWGWSSGHPPRHSWEIDIFLMRWVKAASREPAKRPWAARFARDCRHIRATSFLVSDGVNRSAKRRGRAAPHHPPRFATVTCWARKFFHRLVADLVQLMGDAYPKLREQEGATSPPPMLKRKSASSRRWKPACRFWMPRWPMAFRCCRAVAFKLHDTYSRPGLPPDVCRGAA